MKDLSNISVVLPSLDPDEKLIAVVLDCGIIIVKTVFISNMAVW